MPHKLLLADDSVTIQRVIELTFADENIQVIAVGDGRQAIQRVQSERPDIVLADVGMPERDGYEVTAFIKGTPELAHIPVLLLTGAFEPIDEGRARSVGCDGVLVKPFEPQMVISRVKDLIARPRPVAPAAPPPQPAPTVQNLARPGSPADTMRAATMNPRTPVSGPAAPTGSIEDYFDRLDAAFASMEPAAPPAPSSEAFDVLPPPEPAGGGTFGLAEELASWDPDLELGGASPRMTTPVAAPETFVLPAPVQPALPPAPVIAALPPAPSPAPADVNPVAAGPVMPAAPVSPAAPVPTLAEAFAALLGAEQNQAFSAAPPRGVASTDEMVDKVTQRVIDRLGDRVVRDTVIEVAERLVREEISRLKSQAR